MKSLPSRSPRMWLWVVGFCAPFWVAVGAIFFAISAHAQSSQAYLPPAPYPPACSTAAPAISSGFGATSPSIVASNGTCAIEINVGTGTIAATGVIKLPQAPNGWVCMFVDITTNSTTVSQTKQTASTTTSCTIGNFSDISVGAGWVASDKLFGFAAPF
jgi:hypothetical protein